MPESKLYLFGHPRLEMGDSQFGISRRKAVALLCYLALSQQVHSRDALADLLWPGYGQSEARGHLRRTLFVINQSPAAAWVEVDRSTLALVKPGELWIDTIEFKSYVHAHSHPTGHFCDRCIPELERAVQLYTHHFLAGFSLPDAPDYDEWQRMHDLELRRYLNEALARLVDAYIEAEDWSTAINHVQHRITLDPLHEAAHRQLMRLYVRSERHAEAISQYQECARILESELGVTPSAEATELVNQIRLGIEKQHLAIPHPAPPVRTHVESSPLLPPTRLHNLPSQTMPFMGREQELAEIAKRLADPLCRLLTLSGLGGMGKTRLAQQAAQVAMKEGRFSNGVFMVSLTGIDAPESLAAAIADALGYIVAGNVDLWAAVRDYLRSKSMLLILDNFEQILPTIGLLSEILLDAPGVKLMVTSREVLNLQEEWVLPVTGLHLPNVAAEIDANQTNELRVDQASSALQLFLHKARQVRPDFNLDAEYTHVAEICQLVEGMPLAIELAATWLRMMPCGRIATELQRGLDILASPLRNVPVRHRNMRAVFASSFDFLIPEERIVMSRLSIFRGSFDDEAAAEVAGASFWTLTQLVEKSLVRSRADGGYDLHELVRQYAFEQLSHANGEGDATRNRFRIYFCNKLRTYSLLARGTARQEVMTALDREFGNFRLAWQLAVEQQDIQDLSDGLDLLASFLEWRGRFVEGESLCIESAKPLTPNEDHQIATLLIRFHTWQSTFCRLQGRLQEAYKLAHDARLSLEQSKEFSSPDFPTITADLLAELGQIARHSGKTEQALILFADSRRLYEESGLMGKQARILLRECHVLRNYVGLRNLEAYQAQLQKASALAIEALRVYRELQDLVGTADALHNLAITDTFWRYREDASGLESARELMAEALEIYSALGIRSGVIRILFHYAVTVISYDGNYAEASRYLHQLFMHAQELGSRSGMMQAQIGFGALALAESRYEDAAVHGRQGVAIAKEMNEPNETGIALAFLGMAERKRGNGLAAWRHLDESLKIVEQSGSTTVLWQTLTLAGLLLTDEQQYPLSAEIYAVKRQYRGLHNTPALLNLSSIELAAGLPEELLQTIRTPRPIIDIFRDLLHLCRDRVVDRGEVPID